MTAPCSCDEAKAWKTRALRAELSLKFANQQLERLLARVNDALRLDATAEEDPSEARMPGTWGETVVASGSLPSEIRGLEGLLGYSGGTDEGRQAAVDAVSRDEA